MGMGSLGSALDVAGKGLAIFGGLAGGQASKVDGQINAFKLMSAAEDRKIAAEAGRVRATQTDAEFRENLADVQSTIGAIRSSQNVQFDSPTAMALYEKAERINSRARQVAVSNERIGALSEDMAANNLSGDAMRILANSRRARTNALLGQAKNIVGLGEGISTLAGKLK